MTNTENVKTWVSALRSGEFEQTKGVLEADGKFCCLGVACQVAIRAGVAIDVVPEPAGSVYYDGSDLSLPQSVIDWLGYTRPEPRLGGETLTYLNDHRDKTFNEIADHIEKHMDEDPSGPII